MGSILTDTKKNLGLAEDYTAFDPDVIMHINMALSVLNQLGVGPDDTIVIEDSDVDWDVLEVTDDKLGMIKTYVYLKVRLGFDPPGTSFLISALTDQIQEHEMRISYLREFDIPISVPDTPPIWPWDW